MHFKKILLLIIVSSYNITITTAQVNSPAFEVIAFYTARNDQAHISFVNEANNWFAKMASLNNFEYDSTNDWNNLNS